MPIPPPCPCPDLSPRQIEIVDLMLAGLSRKAVASTLGISVGCVNMHLGRAREKRSAVSVMGLLIAIAVERATLKVPGAIKTPVIE